MHRIKIAWKKNEPAEYDMLLTRPLPEHGRIKGARLVFEGGRRFVQFVVEHPPAPRTERPAKPLGIDVGWRKKGGSVRAAVAYDGFGYRALTIPLSGDGDTVGADATGRMQGANRRARRAAAGAANAAGTPLSELAERKGFGDERRRSLDSFVPASFEGLRALQAERDTAKDRIRGLEKCEACRGKGKAERMDRATRGCTHVEPAPSSVRAVLGGVVVPEQRLARMGLGALRGLAEDCKSALSAEPRPEPSQKTTLGKIARLLADDPGTRPRLEALADGIVRWADLDARVGARYAEAFEALTARLTKHYEWWWEDALGTRGHTHVFAEKLNLKAMAEADDSCEQDAGGRKHRQLASLSQFFEIGKRAARKHGLAVLDAETATAEELGDARKHGCLMLVARPSRRASARPAGT